MRVADDVPLGTATVSIECEGWPEGRVAPNRWQLPVLSRKALPEVKVSSEHQRAWSLDGYYVDELRFLSDKRILVMLRRPIGRRWQQHVRVHDAETGAVVSKVLQLDPEPNQSISGPWFSISSDGRLLAATGYIERVSREGRTTQRASSGYIKVFDFESGKPLWAREVADVENTDSAISPDGKTLITTPRKTIDRSQRDYSTELHAWDAATGKPLGVIPVGRLQLILGLAYSPDEKHLCIPELVRVGEDQKFLHVWSVPEKRVVLKVPGADRAAFSPDGSRLASYSYRYVPPDQSPLGKHSYENEVTLWNLATGKKQATARLGIQRSFVSDRIWLPGGRAMLLPSNLGDLARWDLTDGKPVAVHSITDHGEGPLSQYRAWAQDGHTGRGLYAFGISRQVLQRSTVRNLAEDYDELPPPEIVVWDYANMRRLVTLTGHRGQINCVAFSPDGKTLASGGTDGTVRFWGLNGAPRR